MGPILGVRQNKYERETMEHNENMKDEKKAEGQEEVTETETISAENGAESKKEEIDYKAKYYYIAAEMDNYRKRMEREKDNYVKFGNERVLRDLLEVADNFDRTIGMLKGDQDQKVKNLVVGLDMIQKQFLDTMGKHGLTPIEAIGKEFDPNFHEALSQEYAEGKKPNEVIKEFQKGYTLNGRVIRASKVVVSSDKQ
jgi:molecular chaperone GrpE